MDVAQQADQIANSSPRLDESVSIVDNQIGTVNLVGPGLRRGPLSRFTAWFLRLPTRVEVELDDVGTFVVKHMDGRSMEELSTLLADHYRLTSREAQAALTVFIKSLLQRRLVTLDGLYGNAA